MATTATTSKAAVSLMKPQGIFVCRQIVGVHVVSTPKAEVATSRTNHIAVIRKAKKP